ncbi:MAG TPA: arsenic resistance N-acetyltransferase ArsN2 [Steroidobacteraceae bacterium]|nr:arsenic resistance N-acetyltransferase ArsN2 [Steroidobacteraceae bacterium]
MITGDDSARAASITAKPPLAAVLALLDAAGLPTLDLRPALLEHFFWCGAGDALTGLVGLEFHGADALLRSLAVAPHARGAGLGSALVQHAERYALARSVHRVYLLTTTARGFFEARGYWSVSRNTCPRAIQETSEFAGLCPATAALLMKAL